MKLIVKFFQWSIGISLFINGMSLASQGYFIGLIATIIGLLTIPIFFDWLNISFAANKIYRRFFKLMIIAIGFFIIQFITDSITQNKYDAIQLSIIDLKNKIDNDGIDNIDRKLVDSVNIILKNNLERLPDTLKNLPNDLDKILEIMPSNGKGISRLDYSHHIKNIVQMDKLIDGKVVHFLNDSLLNNRYNKLIMKKLPKFSDFSTKYDYYLYRANHASRNSYPIETAMYIDSILSKTNKIDIDSNTLVTAIEYSKIDKKQFRRIKRYASKKFRNSILINKAIAVHYKKSDDLSNSYKYYSKVIKKTPNDYMILSELAFIAHKRKRKKSAVRHLEKINKLGQLNQETCDLLRELTRYFSHWTYYSNCCDGSTSYSTGRGSCSHHGGVCSTGRSANYRYKYNRCNF